MPDQTPPSRGWEQAAKEASDFLSRMNPNEENFRSGLIRRLLITGHAQRAADASQIASYERDTEWRHRWHDRLGRGKTQTEGKFYEELEARVSALSAQVAQLRQERDSATETMRQHWAENGRLEKLVEQLRQEKETWRARAAEQEQSAAEEGFRTDEAVKERDALRQQVESLRKALRGVMAHTGYLPSADKLLLMGLIASIKRIAGAALSTPSQTNTQET